MSTSSSKKQRIDPASPPPILPPQLESTLIWKQGETISSTGSVLCKLAQSGFTREASQIIGVSRTASLVGRDSDGGLPELWDVMGKIKGKEGITRLMAVCITRGSLSPQRAEALIEDHIADVTETDDYGRTALHLAAGSRFANDPWGSEIASENTPLNPDLIRVLLSKDPKGATREDEFDALPLQYACMSSTNSVEVIQLLVESYEKSLKLSTISGLPLHIALEYKASNDVIRYLINACPKSVHTRVGDDVIDNEDKDGVNFAANVVDPVAAANIDVVVAPIRHSLPLHYAFNNRNISLDIIKLLRADLYANELSNRGELPLHLACSYGVPFKVTKYLFDSFPEGATKWNPDGYLCLHLACGVSSHSYSVIKMLLDYRPEAIKVLDTDKGCLPLHLACEASSHDINVIKLLLDYFPEAIKVKDKDGHLPLHLACKAYSHNLDVIKLLYEAYPDAIKCSSGAGKLAIHLAASSNTSVEVIQFLNEVHRDSVKEKDNAGCIPLHLVCEYRHVYRVDSPTVVFGRTEIVKYLINAFPEGLKEKNKHGCLPIHLACEISYLPEDRLKVIQILLEVYPESVRVKDIIGRLPIHYIIGCDKKASLATVQLLVSAFPEGLKEKDQYGNLPIHLCFGDEYVCDDIPDRFETIQFLINSYPESLMSRNEVDAIPLHMACYSTYERMPFNIFKLLIDSCPGSVLEKDNEGLTPYSLFQDGPPPFDIKRLFRDVGGILEVMVDDGNDAIVNEEGGVEEMERNEEGE